MNNSIKLKIATLGVALGLGMVNTAANAGSSSCARTAIQQTTSYCASIGAGSACGSVHSGIYRYFYDQCMRNGG